MSRSLPSTCTSQLGCAHIRDPHQWPTSLAPLVHLTRLSLGTPSHLRPFVRHYLHPTMCLLRLVHHGPEVVSPQRLGSVSSRNCLLFQSLPCVPCTMSSPCYAMHAMCLVSFLQSHLAAQVVPLHLTSRPSSATCIHT